MHYRSSQPLRVACAALAASVVLAWAAIGAAAPASPAPALPAPTGTVLNVSNEAELQAAMRQLQSNTTVILAPGTYRLTRTLYINGTYSNVGIRGATSRPGDVVIVGAGMSNASYGSVPYGIWTGGNVQDVTIANVTIRDFYFHGIIFNAGTERPLVHNVHLLDSGQQFIKSNPDGSGGGVDGGRVQYSTIEFTTRARDDYPKGVDVHTGTGWRIRHNLFRNLRAPAGQLLGPAILVWNYSSGTEVEGNTFVNCQREIMFGVYDRSPGDHTGGLIRNNMIVRDGAVFGDVGIAVFDSADTQVLHNTILLSGTYTNAIEYRYPGAMNVYIANNLADGTIRQRDGAQAVLQNNVLTATPALFVNALAGDLHLSASATIAIDRGVSAAGVAADWDGDARPQGPAPDVGADELAAPAPAPAPAPTPTPTPANLPPSVRLTSPSSAVTIPLGAWQIVFADATDADGKVARVQFEANGVVLRSDRSAPYSYMWKPSARGVYSLTAVATDDKGARTRSAAVTVTVQ